ncbi:hypothetical protein [Parenemella sanctibonifatiensis]|uniref:Uncharacterized protein n=1 Tax=Parenemella sanctibonifatiensis TaxID=2016505 RepID=A0A255EA63_9ACTN|nr:hypothetical protein [Parenemella sanctibonifatiensis]OYN88449.1 hypothetical protein CGZ92_04210 [Parenemella sanctibonifatiensis]
MTGSEPAAPQVSALTAAFRSLTGEDPPDDAAGTDLAAVLLAVGWDRERLGVRRQQAARWPDVLPASEDPAQAYAMVLAVRNAWNLNGPVRLRGSSQPGPDEERLLRDRPPHHG